MLNSCRRCRAFPDASPVGSATDDAARNIDLASRIRRVGARGESSLVAPCRWPVPPGEEMTLPEPTSTRPEHARYEPPVPQPKPGGPGLLLDSFSYDDAIVRKFLDRHVRLGRSSACSSASWSRCSSRSRRSTFAPCFTFGRLRPLHTNAVIFAFAGNMIFAGVYYSTQRLLKARMFSRLPEPIPLLGLAGDHRRRRDHAAARLHAGARSTRSSSGRSTSRSRSSGSRSR